MPLICPDSPDIGNATTAREPGFTTGSPCAQSGHVSGS